MTTKDELLTELNEVKLSIQNNNYNRVNLAELIEKINSAGSSFALNGDNLKSSLIKNLLITFNIANFSDLTILFITNSENMQIIESAGLGFLLDEFKYLYDTDNKFYKNTDNLKVNGNNYRIFYESMENEKGIYTIITLTESAFFKPSNFHILSDIIMDILRSSDMSRASIFNDLFEETIIGISSYLASSESGNQDFYLFKFENIYDFFLKMGLEIIIELSEVIKTRLAEVFGSKSPIFRFSLSEYIVISPEDSPPAIRFSDLNNRNVLDFNYKGIVLQHRCIKIPNKNKSIYDVFETIYKIENNTN